MEKDYFFALSIKDWKKTADNQTALGMNLKIKVKLNKHNYLL